MPWVVVSEIGEEAKVAQQMRKRSITIEKGSLYAKEGYSPV